MFRWLIDCSCAVLLLCLVNVATAQQQTNHNAIASWRFDNSLADTTGKMSWQCFNMQNASQPDAIKWIAAQDQHPAAVNLPNGHLLRITGPSTKSIMLHGEQTIWTRIKLTNDPRGIIWSRHRPEDGLRGMELGLTAKHAWEPDGPLPCVTISGGVRGNTVFLVSDKPLQVGTWYDLFVTFIPEKSVQLDVIESQTGIQIIHKMITEKVPDQINPNGGEKIFTLGARRNNSSQNSCTLSDDSQHAGFGVWDHALDQQAMADVVGHPLIQPKPAAIRQPQNWYVNTKAGSDEHDGSTMQQAFATITRACNKLVPGDTILIAPGVYMEQVRITDHGTAKQPITIKAIDPTKNAVILSLADPTLRQGKQQWDCVDKSLHLYATPMDHWPARVLYDQIGLMPYPTLDTLKQFTLFDEYPGPLNGFAYVPEEKKLYVRLDASGKYGSTDPNEHVMAASPVNAKGSNGHSFNPNTLDANLVIDGDGDGYVEIQGLTFETPGAVGVLAMRHHVTVRDSYFVGCRFGVGGRAQSADVSRTTHFVTVDNCEYSRKPIFDDMVDVIQRFHGSPIAKKHTYFWWHRKGHNSDRDHIKNDETGILGNVGSNWVLKNSDIHDAFEGLATWGGRWAKDLTITHNRFYRLVDNAIETEDHAANVTIDHNWIEDVFEPFSWQPLGGTPWPGPVFIHDNVVMQSETFGKLWELVGHTPGAFKIGASGRNWQQNPHMGATEISEKYSLISKRFVAPPDPGFVVHHNTIIFSYGNLLTLPHPTYGPMTRELANFRFFDNIFVSQQLYTHDDWQGSLMEFDGNLNVCLQSQSQSANITAGEKGKVLHQLDAVGFINPLQRDYGLRDDSTARSMGITIKGLIERDGPVGVDWDAVKSLRSMIAQPDCDRPSDSGR